MIYNLNAIPRTWVPETNLSRGMIYIMRQFVYNAKKKFDGKKDQKFLQSIKPNTTFEKPYLYTYDIDLANPRDTSYGTKMMDLIRVSNEELKQDKSLAPYYRIDMMGTYERGMIIVMKQKDLKADPEKIVKSQMKKYGKKIKNAHQKAINDLDEFLIQNGI